MEGGAPLSPALTLALALAPTLTRSVLEGIGGRVPDEVPEVEAPDGGGLINISGDNLKIRKPDFSFLNPQELA